jgi:hypothetical protein
MGSAAAATGCAFTLLLFARTQEEAGELRRGCPFAAKRQQMLPGARRVRLSLRGEEAAEVAWRAEGE